MLELQRNLYVLRRWWWVLLGAALLGGLTAYLLTKALVQQEYRATTIVSIGPSPAGASGPFFAILSANADAQLVANLSTAEAARSSLPADLQSRVSASKLSNQVDGVPSVEGQLLYVGVRWTDSTLVKQLADAVAAAFIVQERSRLESRYRIIAQGLLNQEQHLARLIQSQKIGGPAGNWLQAQYADTLSRLYTSSNDARIQASAQEAALQVARPAPASFKTGPKASTNALLGAALAFLVALVFAFLATRSYEGEEEEAARPILTRVAD